MLTLIDGVPANNEFPDWYRNYWASWQTNLLDLKQDWEVWFDWYEAKLLGASWPASLEYKCAKIRNELWIDGAILVNAKIRRLKGAESSSTNGNFENSHSGMLVIPPQHVAALQPKMKNGRLVLPRSTAKSYLNGQSPSASLKALQKQILDLASATENEANIDRRVPTRLREIGNEIPSKSPRQEVLFEIGHKLEELTGYAKKVNDEWPNSLAARYHSMTRAYDRTLRQFPKWVEFLNATAPRLAHPQKEMLPEVAKKMVDALRDPNVSAYVDANLTNALEVMGTALGRGSTSQLHPDEELASSKDALAHDFLESVSNTLKSVAEKTVEVTEFSNSAATAWGGEAKKTFVHEAKQQGKKDGRALFQWTRRLILSSATTGGVTLAHYLSGAFPEYFGWLIPLITFLGTVSASTAKGVIDKRKVNKN